MMQYAAHLAIPTNTQNTIRPTYGKKSLMQPVVAVILMDKTIPITTASPSSTTTTTYSCQAQALQLHGGRTGIYHHQTPVPKSTPKKLNEIPPARITYTATQTLGLSHKIYTHDLKRRQYYYFYTDY